MDEEKKNISRGEKAFENPNLYKKGTSNQKIKPKPSNILDNKITNNIPKNSLNNNTSTKNQLAPIAEKNSISKNKKHNSIGFGSLQKKLNPDSSHKNLDYGRATSNLMNSAHKNNNVNLDTTSYFNASNIDNNSKLGNAANTTNDLKGIENLNVNNKEKEKDAVNLLNNTHETNTDQHIQSLSIFSGAGNDLSTNQVSLLEAKNMQSTNLYNTINTFSHQNSINNISTSSDSSHIKVIVRFRPMNSVENEMVEKKIGFKCVDFKSLDTIGITNSFNNSQNFTFDRVYDDKTSQQMLYTETAKPLITDILRGYNGTIFTYGQSGSGKTYTMYGAELLDEETQGIIPRAINKIFEFINSEENKDIRFELKFSMLEIYQEQLYDLLNPSTKSQELKIKEHSKKGIYVENLSEVYISSQEEFLVLIHEAERARIVKETGLNKCSSRSHLLFQLQITQKFPDDTERRGLLNLIDLAGSEKVSKTHAIGETLNEAKKINSSLSILGKVISILATSTGEYVPYRESKLTRILQDSLGGNSKTILVVNCSIHSYNADETIYTLNFAKRAKKIKNKVKINIKHSAEQLEAIIEILSNKLRLANEEINKLKGIRAASPLKSGSMLLIGNEENNAANLIPKSGENSLIKNLFTTTFNGVNINGANNNGDNYADNNLNSNEILDSAELIKDLNLKLKKKDEELALLNDKLDVLQNENKNLQEKLENVNKQNNIDKYIESLDKSLRENLESLKEICTANKKDEIEALTLRMKEIKKFYDDFEKNYVHLFKKITDFKEIDLEKKINMIINDNFEDGVNHSHHKYNNSKKAKNLNVNINHFNNINNITVHNHHNSNSNTDLIDNNYPMSRKMKNEKDNLSKFNQGNSEVSNIKNNQNTEESVSPSKQNEAKRTSFQDPDSILDFVRPANKNSSSPSAILSFNNSNKNSSSNRGSQNKIPNYQFKINNTTRNQLKKGKNILTNKEENKDLNIQINKGEKLKKETKGDLNINNNPDENFDDFIGGAKGNEANSSNLNSKKDLIFESTNNIKSNDFKDNIISEAKKKANFENEIIKNVKKINNLKHNITNNNENKNEIPIIEFDKEDGENNSSANSIPKFGGYINSFNFHCEDLFKKIEMQVNSNKKLNSCDLIVLSYKNIFLSNKIYSIKIFDEFLKRKEYNNNQKSYESLFLNSSLVKKQNAFSTKPANDSLFSPESKNKKLNFIKDNYFMSPNSDLKELEKLQENKIENNLFTSRFNNQIKNAFSNINFANLSNNNDCCWDNCRCDSDYFIKMKSCILKLMLKIIYFENTNYDMLNRLTIDLKIFQSKSKNSSKMDDQLEKISNIFTNYLDVLQELKKFKINSEYEEKLLNKAEFLDGKGGNTNNPQELYLNSANNLNNMISNNNNNLNTEISSYNNSFNLTGIKKLARLSTIQLDLNNVNNTNNPLLLQTKNSIFKQSKMNLNSNIIKNITKRSSLVLNNLGYSLAFRKSVYEPTSCSPVLCPNCNNYYYNNGPTKPFNIGVNEDGTLLKNATPSNTNLNTNPNIIDNANKNPSNNNSNNYVKMIIETNLASDNYKSNEKINSECNPTSNKSIEKDLLVSNSSGKTDSVMKSRNQSKNVSFFLTNEQKENLINNTEKGNAIDKCNFASNKNDPEIKQNTISNNDKPVTSNNKNVNKNSILKISKLKNYQDMNNAYNSNAHDKKQNHDSKLVNESDASLDNVNHSKFYKGPSPDLMDRNKFFNQNINLDSNKNIDLITTFNNNFNNLNSQNHISKLVSTNNSNKIQPAVMKKNTIINNDLNDYETANIRSKWEALRQSVISTASNNNLKIIQDENFSELKLAKKETLLYKNCFDSITTDYKKLKSSSKNTEKFLNQELENYRKLKEVEIEKFAKALEMYNDLHTKQLKVKDLKIKQLAALIDHMVENEAGNILYNDNLGTSNNYDTILITDDQRKKYEFILDKKNCILNTSRDLNMEENSEISLLKLTDFLVNQEGTATKKLDYITIELSENPELIKFKYGSGLGHRIPTKSPLFRNLTTTLAGDQNHEVTISELSD